MAVFVRETWAVFGGATLKCADLSPRPCRSGGVMVPHLSVRSVETYLHPPNATSICEECVDASYSIHFSFAGWQPPSAAFHSYAWAQIQISHRPETQPTDSTPGRAVQSTPPALAHAPHCSRFVCRAKIRIDRDPTTSAKYERQCRCTRSHGLERILDRPSTRPDRSWASAGWLRNPSRACELPVRVLLSPYTSQWSRCRYLR